LGAGAAAGFAAGELIKVKGRIGIGKGDLMTFCGDTAE
jgi:hypothetical protein